MAGDQPRQGPYEAGFLFQGRGMGIFQGDMQFAYEARGIVVPDVLVMKKGEIRDVSG
jgi:hypothetical protein